MSSMSPTDETSDTESHVYETPRLHTFMNLMPREGESGESSYDFINGVYDIQLEDIRPSQDPNNNKQNG